MSQAPRFKAEPRANPGLPPAGPGSDEGMREATNKGNSLLSAALAYAQKGWPVFPVYEPNTQGCSCGNQECEHIGKHPRTGHGWRDASTDPVVIEEWWRTWPDANVAIAMGGPGRLVALDIDGPAGEASLEELVRQHGILPTTLESLTGTGRHILMTVPEGVKIPPSVSVLGEKIDIRPQGTYIVAPPSLHVTGRRYRWASDQPISAMPEWLLRLLTVPAPPQPVWNSGGAGGIPQGKRNRTLTCIAGGLRRQGLPESEIAETLLGINSRQCVPSLSDAEVRRIAASVAKYPAGVASSPSGTAWKAPSADPWAAAETMKTFLSDEEVGAEFLDDQKRLVARGCVTEIFSPRGLGKSLFALNLALACAQRGLRVMYLDRDNSRFVVKGRLRGFGAEPETPNLKIITREKCPPLTNALAWSTFPYADYDLVILDSLDSASEGIGEQDSAKPSKAIAPLLDITRREKGPGVIVLGNTVRTGKHSRGSGVIEDRADIVFEVRDATNFQPQGSRPWVEELPPADAGSWAARSSRRKRSEKYQLAFIPSKFRIDQEPEPFIVEINTAVEPWTIRDVTDEVDQQGKEARVQRAAEKEKRIAEAATALVQEIARRATAGEPPLAKRRDAEGFLVKRGLKRSEARQCLAARDGTLWVLSPIDGRTVVVLPAGCKKEEYGHVLTPTESAKSGMITDAECGRLVSMHSAAFDTPEVLKNSTCGHSENMAEGSTFTTPVDRENLPTPEPLEVDKEWSF